MTQTGAEPDRASLSGRDQAGWPDLRQVYIMDQRTKWGNCFGLGNLPFNWCLIMAPDEMLRYIVTHEVVHLAIPDHSPKFGLTVQSLDPQTEHAQQWLVANGRRLMVSLSELVDEQD